MILLDFRTPDGFQIYINPDQVVAVTADPDDAGCTLIYTQWIGDPDTPYRGAILVKGPVEKVTQWLQGVFK